MNDVQAEKLIRIMTGYWPTPAMKPEEALVWSQTLARCQDDDLAGVVLQSLSDNGEMFRPPAGVFRKAYNEALKQKQVRKIMEPDQPALESGDRIASPEFAAMWIAKIRKQLEGMNGPFAKQIGDVIEGQAHATTVRQYVSPERKKILAAVNEINEEGWVAP